jgi:adenine-specific DNA-methyltransferase
LHNLSIRYDIETLEKHLIYTFLNLLNLDYTKNPILTSYFKFFEQNSKLSLEISHLNVRSIKELENYLELLIPANDRKINGAFFTPTYITNFIINSIKPKENDKNLDPSCGCGAFLIELVKFYQSNFNKKIKQTIRDNIYGADILDYNIRRAKLLLSIFALQSNEIVEEKDFNLTIQDSLQADWQLSFKRNSTGIFDNIVGNPPYVKYQDLSAENRSYLLKNWLTINKGTYNLYFAFFELGYNLLNENGMVGYITPNNYFTSLAAESLRTYFHSNQCVRHIYDFNHKKVFDSQTYTAITFLNKKINHTICYHRINEGQEPEIFLKKTSGSPNKIKGLNYKKWRLLKSNEQKNIKIIETIGIPINEMVKISVGIATLKDELYFLNSNDRKKGLLLKTVDDEIFEIEPGITKSIYKISDFKSQEECSHNTRRIIFPYKINNGKAIPIIEKELRRNFPKCYIYFKYIKKKLSFRSKGKKEVEPFYAYGRNQSLTKIGEKILTPTFSKYPRFMIVEDKEALFCNGYGLFFNETNAKQSSLFDHTKHPLSKKENIHILQKVLSSFIMHYYVSKTSVSIEGGYPCYQKNFIEKFTIPEFTNKEIKLLAKMKTSKRIDEFLINKYQLNFSANLVDGDYFG